MRALDALLETFQGKKTDHAINAGAEVAQAKTTDAAGDGPKQHFAFLKGKPAEVDLERSANSALNEAGIKRSPHKLYEAINGFAVDLSGEEAEKLRALLAEP